jgi:hypothetical protein
MSYEQKEINAVLKEFACWSGLLETFYHDTGKMAEELLDHRTRLAAQEAIMKRAAAVCGSEEDWERIDELVALLHSQYTQERESANQYAQMNYGKLNNIIHELEFLVNKYSFDAKTNTPDYILAEYLYECLMNYVEVTWKNDIHRKASDENTNNHI